jgi:hypothetical protein
MKDGSVDCKYFDGCSAPICPKDPGQEKTTWFVDEDMCRLADVPEWVRRQRKISRKAIPGGYFTRGYFTLAMLKQDCRITKGIKGIDPNGSDKERAAGEAAWCTAHPVSTQEEREKYTAIAKKLNAKSLGFQGRKWGNPCGLNVGSEEKGIEIPPA